MSQARQEKATDRRFALSVDLGFYAVDSEIETNLREAAALLRNAGAVVEEVDLGWTSRIIHAWYDINNTLYAALFAIVCPNGASASSRAPWP